MLYMATIGEIMENTKIDYETARCARLTMRFLKKYNPVFYNRINDGIKQWFLNYCENADTGEPKVTGTNTAVFIEDGYQNEPCVCSFCGEPERDAEHQKNANYCAYCGAKIIKRGE